jgi:hypothetical protein
MLALIENRQPFRLKIDPSGLMIFASTIVDKLSGRIPMEEASNSTACMHEVGYFRCRSIRNYASLRQCSDAAFHPQGSIGRIRDNARFRWVS